jgi:hemoglobin
MGGSEILRGLGGAPGCRALAESLYAGIAGDPLLRPLFPKGGFHCAIEELSAYLVQFLGGPAEHSQRRWWLSLRESHLRFRVGVGERDAWMGHMARALESVADESVRLALRAFFEETSTYLINTGERPLTQCPLVLDQAVAAIRKRDSERAFALAAQCDPGVLPGLLALMIATGDAAMAEYAAREVRRDLSLLSQRYAGRTLLHAAAGLGETRMVKLLLELGADPNGHDGGSHAPLYSVANQCKSPGGAEVVRALVRAGARVDAADGVQRCTALHMAARRGSIGIGEALLDCGARIDARDRGGATPLRRALNCRKTAFAEFLRAKGARE